MNRRLATLFITMLVVVSSACAIDQTSRPVLTSESPLPTTSQSRSKQTSSAQADTVVSSEPLQTSYVNGFGHASRDLRIDTLKDLEGHSSLIALVTVQQESIEIRANKPDPANGILPQSHVLTPVLINRVIQTIDKHVEGDTVFVEEYYSTWPSTVNPDVLVIYTDTFQRPLEVGKQYILFLTTPLMDGDYGMVLGDMGKYAYNEKTMNVDSITSFHSLSNLDLEIADVDPKYIPRQYYDIAFNVIAKYIHNK